MVFKDSNPDDYLIGATIADDELSLLVVSENGYGKRTALGEYRLQSRGGMGILTMNCTDKTGKIVGAEMVGEDNRLLVMTLNGKGIRVKVKEIRTTGRVAQGVKLIDLANGDAVRSIARIIQGADDGDLDVELEGDETQATEETGA